MTLLNRNVLKGCQKVFFVQLPLRNAANSSIHCVPDTAFKHYIHMLTHSILTTNIPNLKEETEAKRGLPQIPELVNRGAKIQTHAVSTHIS